MACAQWEPGRDAWCCDRAGPRPKPARGTPIPPTLIFVSSAAVRLSFRPAVNTCWESGSSGVASPPLPEVSSGIWLSAGYEPFLTLDLYSRELVGALPEPAHPITTGGSHDWDAIVRLDKAAFPKLWRLDKDGLQEALAATPHSRLLLTHDGDRLHGFAVVGVGSIAGYLQRVAVHPEYARQGIGRSLVRAANSWARRRGARSMMLNTQGDNESAARLYGSEGFEKMLDQLTVLRFSNP